MLFVLLGAIAIGLVLGLLGSGGSILTVPVLVYLAGEPDKVAIAESLAIVGAIAAVGAVPYARQKLVDWRSVLYFGVPGIIGTYGGAALSKFIPGPVQLALFAVVMLLAAVLMLRGKKAVEENGEGKRQAAWLIVIEGLIVGVLTGLVGVGGGFLIVPALVLLGGLPMRLAVGTSLLIVAAKSAAGFVKYVDVLAETGLSVDWKLIGLFAAVGIVGSFVGNALSHRVPQAQLKRGFAVFLVIMGLFILYKEAPAALAGTPPAPTTAAPASDPSSALSGDTQAGGAQARPGSVRAPGVAGRLRPADVAAFLREHPGAAVLDVRTPPEIALSGTLAGAIEVAYAPGFTERALALIDPDQPVVLYCASGGRSNRAAELLAEAGVREAYNAGGFAQLQAAGLPTE